VIGDALDVLGGLFRLTRRTPTLDGSVPVRVARACVPLLEGNAYGLQLTLTRPLLVRRRLGRWSVRWSEGDDVERRHAGALPRLPEEGYLPRDGGWMRALAGPVARPRPHGIRIFTGLLVRPAPHVWLRLTSAANRRNTLFEAAEQLVPDDGAWVPVVLDLKFRRGAPAALRLEGELGCLGPVRPGAHFSSVAAVEARDLARAHAAFYDRGYFEDKREEVTGKYRRLVGGESAREGDAIEHGPVPCRVAALGPSRHEIEPLDRFTTADGPVPVSRPQDPRRLDSVVFRNEVAFAALYDGHTLTLDYDRAALRSRTRAVEEAWRAAAGDGGPLPHPGSELYLTKYFTPHPPGEPHFFVKPWALTATPPGWSCLLDGLHGEGYDVLRGVVSTDVFHATPAVFRVHREGAPVRVAERAPLLRVIPVPRALLAEDIALRRLE
jgi:hypothetical protein